ncbi:MAG: hypothetical protein JST52_02470 [Bacteroidetes bacterium]|nr:hypothetical protein [Bacteroidota bacterium]MBS1777049.1 hypothetical protein [Bacteroidota bacterium]
MKAKAAVMHFGVCFFLVSYYASTQKKFLFMARSYGEYLRRVPSSEILDVYQSGTSDKIVV